MGNLQSGTGNVNLGISGGDEGNRTLDLRVANAALSQAELHPHGKDSRKFLRYQLYHANRV